MIYHDLLAAVLQQNNQVDVGLVMFTMFTRQMMLLLIFLYTFARYLVMFTENYTVLPLYIEPILQ
jgi:hypothetical protein